jgi:hypothetical protein
VRRQVDGLLSAWPDRPDRFWSLCARVTGWDSLLECASQHGVLEALRPGLLDERSPLSAGQRSWIKRTRILEQWMQTSALETLTDVLAVFASTPIKAVALKGPVLSERLYGDSGARRFSDLDFLVAPEDLERVIAALQPLGYVHEAGASEAFFRAYHHHIHLQAPERPVLELHFILSSNFGVSMAAAPFLARAIPFVGKLGTTWVLAPEDEFLYLATHAAGHYFERTAWLHDLKMLLLHHPNLDEALITKRAEEIGVARSLRFTRHVLHERLGLATADNGNQIRHWLGDRLLALIDALPARGMPRKLAGWAYEGILADRIGHVPQLFRRRLASWRAARGDGVP